jgi:pimeloyl-ACP methyl ester carboxylesterase
MSEPSDQFTHRNIEVSDGVRIHCASAGQNGGKRPLVVLLHGFPEFWWSWRNQIKALAGAGFHVVAPDLRGYNASDKPAGVGSYKLARLSQDVADVIRAYGADKAYVAGHDWGGAVAWELAMHHPEVVEKLAILNCPHPVNMAKGLRTLKQLKKSWYMFLFQIPRLPEMLIAKDDYAGLRRTLAGAMSEAEIARYIDAASKPGALTAMLNYYRASIRGKLFGGARRPRPIDAPVMIVWGERDKHLGRELARPPARLVPNLRMEWVPEGSHWVQNDAADRVNELFFDFFGAPGKKKRVSLGVS